MERCICDIENGSLRLFMLCHLIPDRILKNACCMKRLEMIYESDRHKLDISWKVLSSKKEAITQL